MECYCCCCCCYSFLKREDEKQQKQNFHLVKTRSSSSSKRRAVSGVEGNFHYVFGNRNVPVAPPSLTQSENKKLFSPNK